MEITKWDYRWLGYNAGEKTDENTLKELGRQGWEAVSIDYSRGGIILFKRPYGKLQVIEKNHDNTNEPSMGGGASY